MPKEFRLKGDHLKLLRRAVVTWDGSGYGAPGLDQKRPYGNGDASADVCIILGWPKLGEEDGEPAWTPKQRTDAEALHRETQAALQIVLVQAGLQTYPGLYEMERDGDCRSWRHVGP